MNSLTRCIEKAFALCHGSFISASIASENQRLPKKYGNHFDVVLEDLKQTDDLRVLDYNGYNVFYNFKFSGMSKPVYHEVP